MAEQKISNIEFQLEVLEQLQHELGGQQQRTAHLKSEMAQEKMILADANGFPQLLEAVGVVSIFVLAAGTLLQLMSLA